MCSQKRVGKHLLVNVDNKCQSSMVCGRFYDKFGHKNGPHISDRVRKLISIPIPTDRAGVSWLSGSNVGLPSGSPAFESDRRTEISSYGLSDLNQFYHIGTHNTAVGEMITPA